MSQESRSGCPINLTLELLGDRWSLLLVRDIVFGNRRSYRELLGGSMEGVSTTVLADRIRVLVEYGLLTGAPDPHHKQRTIYSLTERGIQLIPILVELGKWGSNHLTVTDDMAARARFLSEGGPALLEEFMDELRVTHLGKAPPVDDRPSVASRMQAAYEATKAAAKA